MSPTEQEAESPLESSEAENAPGTQLELHFASEVSGASWADQRAHSEMMESLVERLRREGL